MKIDFYVVEDVPTLDLYENGLFCYKEGKILYHRPMGTELVDVEASLTMSKDCFMDLVKLFRKKIKNSKEFKMFMTSVEAREEQGETSL